MFVDMMLYVLASICYVLHVIYIYVHYEDITYCRFLHPLSTDNPPRVFVCSNIISCSLVGSH